MLTMRWPGHILQPKPGCRKRSDRCGSVGGACAAAACAVSFPRRRESRMLRTPPPVRAEVSKPCGAIRGGSCSLREAAPGFRPGGRPPFFVSTKKGGKESDPADSALALRGLPCAARSLRVGQNSLRGLQPLRSNSRPKSVVDARCRALPQSPALLSSSEGGVEHQTRLAAHRLGGVRVFEKGVCALRIHGDHCAPLHRANCIHP
jgi:hypothetical protein